MPIDLDFSSDEPVSHEEHQLAVANRMTEKQLQEAIVAMAKRLGWMSYHTYFSGKSTGGYPDLHLIHPATGRQLFRELKTTKGKVSPDQQKWLDGLAACNVDAGVWRPLDYLNGRVRDELEPAPLDHQVSIIPSNLWG